VIAASAGSLPEVVGDGGLLVPPEDESALAAAMVRVAADQPLQARLRERAAVQARRFSWQESTAALLRAYRAALAA
jgi:glycosyltransferase involved in cell wall biosynthesis